VSLFVNLVALSTIEAIRARPKSLLELFVNYRRPVVVACFLGSAFVSFPIGLYAWFGRTGLNPVGFSLLMFGPSLFGAAHALAESRKSAN